MYRSETPKSVIATQNHCLSICGVIFTPVLLYAVWNHLRILISDALTLKPIRLRYSSVSLLWKLTYEFLVEYCSWLFGVMALVSEFMVASNISDLRKPEEQ